MARKSQKNANKADSATKDKGAKKKSSFAMAKDKAVKMQKKKKTQPRRKKEKGHIIEYFKGVKLEMRKVVWPTKKELGSFTVIVLCTCAAFALLFWGVDSGVLAAIKAVCF